ncbi:uncharacterized protein J8A68_000818 [[Candida] subhashii]|uniref:F-box domain-containing protein n=1 Tax=[Candida] subhashii TaxID=561895 RepID=A0A8J5UTC1_9ASCO|nr:uncharacterized protein J8A68_000818 [[Candida] subhashii]KAG7665612.1 hypothetical protein J8A68_000818 [[Candida] subhashii]
MTNSQIHVSIFSLPQDVLELVLSYIPTINLLSFTNIPNLDELIRNELRNRHIKVIVYGKSATRPNTDPYPAEFWEREIIGDDSRLDSRSVSRYEDLNRIVFNEPDSVERFLDFKQRHPNLIANLNIVENDILEELVTEAPWCFQDIQSLTFTERQQSENYSETLSSLLYKYLTVQLSDLGINLPEMIWSLELSDFFKQKNHLQLTPIEYQIKELSTRCPIEVEDYKYLPRALQTLNTKLALHSPRCTLELPLTLEQLTIDFDSVEDLTEINISDLPKLKKLRLDSFPSQGLRSMNAPKQLENLSIFSRNLVSLESIAEYHMLRELEVSIAHSDGESMLDCTLPDSLQRLRFTWWVFRNSDRQGEDVEESHCMSPVRLPSNLKSLDFQTNSPLLCLREWIIPPSLRVLSFDVEKLPVGFKIPPNLISLSIRCSENGSLPRPLPKSLIRLHTTLVPPTKWYLTQLKNLTQLNCDFIKHRKSSFDWKLPTSLKRLIIAHCSLEALNINVPNLKAVDLHLKFPDHLEKLELPSSVVDLKIYSIRDNKISELSISKKHKLPTKLKTLNLLHDCMDSKSLNNLHLKKYQHLWYINLFKNKIKKVADGVFPASTKVLILSSNPLNEVEPNAFKNLPNLQYLYLDCCNLGVAAARNQSLEFPTSLKYVQLSCNYLKDISSFHFPSENMTRIRLSFNTFPDKEKIVETLKAKLGENVAIEI